MKNLQPNRFSLLFISKCVLVLFCVLLFHSRQINVFETCRFFFSLSQEFFLINDVFDALFMVAVAISSMFCGLKVFFLSFYFLSFESSRSWRTKCKVSSIFSASLIHKHTYFWVSHYLCVYKVHRLKNRMRTEIDSNCKNHVQFAPLNRKITHTRTHGTPNKQKSAVICMCLFVCLFVQFFECWWFFTRIHLHHAPCIHNLSFKELVYQKSFLIYDHHIYITCPF